MAAAAFWIEIADECSSIPAIAALVSLGVAYATLIRRPLGVRLTLMVATLPLAIASNIIRITMITAAVYYVGPWTFGSLFHYLSGTVNFILTFLLVLLLDALLGPLSERNGR